MSVQTIGGVSGNSALILVGSVYNGLDVALNNPATKPAWHGTVSPICMYQDVAGQLANHPGAMGKTIPKTAVFTFSPPTAVMELMAGGQGRTLNPLVKESLTVNVSRYGCGYYIERSDFYADVVGMLRRVPEKLARPVTKLGDVLLAQVLRTGKTTLDFTATNFFAASKPVSPAGTTTATAGNLNTARGLNAANLLSSINQMRALKNEDGLSLNIKPDTLTVPSELVSAALIASTIEYPVYSLGDSPFTPGQGSGSAMGQNIVAVSKWIKQVCELPELTIGNATVDTKTWYLQECCNPEHGGAPGLVLAEDPSVDFFVQMDLSDASVWFDDRYAWAVQKYSGAGPGLWVFIQRNEAP